MVVTLGQQYNVGEKPTVMLYTYINHHAQPPVKAQLCLKNNQNAPRPFEFVTLNLKSDGCH